MSKRCRGRGGASAARCGSRPRNRRRAAAGAVGPEALFRALSRTTLLRLAEWDRGRGFAAIRAAWLARAIGLTEIIRVSLPERQLQGRFESLDPAGRLLLRREDGTLETITA